MNSTLRHADSLTHFKIVATALSASIFVCWLGLASHIQSDTGAAISFELRYALSPAPSNVMSLTGAD